MSGSPFPSFTENFPSPYQSLYGLTDMWTYADVMAKFSRIDR